MKAFSVILICALVGVIAWLVFFPGSGPGSTSAKGELAARGQANNAQPAPASSGQVPDQARQITAAQSATKATSPSATLPTPVAPAMAPSPRQSPLSNSPAVRAAIEAADAAPIPATPRQRQIKGAPKLAEVKHYAKDYGFIEITAGSTSRIEVGMPFAIRRDNAIIARVKITDVDTASSVADVDSRSVPAGVNIEIGDEVIQDLPEF